MKVEAHFSFPTTHLLDNDKNALCGSKLYQPFDDIRAIIVDYELVNCKKCRIKYEKQLKENEKVK